VQLYRSGGVALVTSSPDTPRLVIRTTIQPDGDIITNVSRQTRPEDGAVFARHLLVVEEWFRSFTWSIRGLQSLITTATALASAAAAVIAVVTVEWATALQGVARLAAVTLTLAVVGYGVRHLCRLLARRLLMRLLSGW
jgi:hypothetical protein